MDLKINLLMMILESPSIPNKYSRSFLNLKSVIDLEQKDDEFELPKNLLKDYKEIADKFYSFMSGIPLIVIERYFNEHKEYMNKYVYLEYKESELTDMKISELLYLLEQYFMQIYYMAIDIANYYNIEVKLNNKESNQKYL